MYIGRPLRLVVAAREVLADTPRNSSWIPPISSTRMWTEAMPETSYRPASLRITTTGIAAKAVTDKSMPSQAAALSGRAENDTIPLAARLSSLDIGYFELPAKRASRS